MATIHELHDRAGAAISEGDHGRALALVRLVRRHFPDDFEAMLLLGQIHLESGRYGEARDALEAVLEVDPESVLARSALAMVAEEEGDLDGALQQFERAFGLDTSNHHLAAEIARLQSQLDHTTPVDPSSSMHAMARRLLLAKKYDRALPLFEEARFIAPGMAEVALGAAQALWLAKRPREAEELAAEILVPHPRCLKALVVLAGVAFLRGDEQCKSMLRDTARLNPGNGVAAGLFVEAGLVLPKVGREVEIPPDEGPEEAPESIGILPAQAEEPASEGGDHTPADQSPDEGATSVLGFESNRNGFPELEIQEEPSPRQQVVEGSGMLLDRLAEALSEPDSLGESRVVLEPAELPRTIGREEWARAQRLPLADLEGERVVRRVGAAAWGSRQGDAALHLSFARSFEARGQTELALDEYRTALRSDSSTARAVSDAAQGVVQADPNNLKAHWLLGDTLVIEGRLRQAVEHYRLVLESGGGSSGQGNKSAPTMNSTRTEKEQDGTHSGHR